MKTALLLLLTATAAQADGFSPATEDPTVIAPARDADWTGAYAGVSYGRVSGERTVTTTMTDTQTVCRKLGAIRDCDDPIQFEYPDLWEVETTTTTSTATALQAFDANEAGLFGGYRHDFGAWVVGGEVNLSKNLRTAEAQLGLDAGRVMPFLLVGYGKIGEETSAVYGVGADVLIGRNVLAGVKAVRGDGGEAVMVRVGWRF